MANVTREQLLEQALRDIVEIGKRDLSNPKYDGYFEEARAALAAPPPDETRARHGYGCPNDGDEMAEGVNCTHCCRHGWVEHAHNAPCPRCYSNLAALRAAPAPPPEGAAEGARSHGMHLRRCVGRG